ncbi:MAG: GNAT family N-acetyltransferase [Hoeflea sp.]|uniref:GNAT family N-acetyltransferase n=1 Tax=Hoeflea sp. TaxID=1940281 RepID=UPI0032EFC77B
MTSVRLATPSDLPACAAIINDYIDATPWLPRTVSREELEGIFTPDLLESRVVLVAENDNAIAGYASLDKEAGFLHALYLRPESRRQGVGKALLNATKAARPGGFDLTVFELNANACRFYVREGLIEVPEGRKTDTEEGIPTLLMRWTGEAA